MTDNCSKSQATNLFFDGMAVDIESLGFLADAEMQELLHGADSLSFSNRIWTAARKGRLSHPREWARALTSMASSRDFVNRALPNGQLPIIEMAGWGSEFYGACEAFSLAGASCWKRDIRRARLVDVAKNCPELRRANWLREAMSRDERFETTSAKLDLQFNDASSGVDLQEMAMPSLEEWAARFEWESRQGPSSFDVECAWILTSKSTPAQALNIWRRVLGDEGISRKELSEWVMGCKWGRIGEFPSEQDLLPLSTKEMSVHLGKAALARGAEDGAAKDPRRVDGLTEALQEACEACGVDFMPAAAVLAKQASDWEQWAEFGLAKTLRDALVRANARWEARIFGRLLSPSASAPRRHL